MRLGFLAHASELNGAKNDVLSNASPLNWALFGLATRGGGVNWKATWSRDALPLRLRACLTTTRAFPKLYLSRGYVWR